MFTKADQYFYDHIEMILNQNNSTKDNDIMVRPTIPSTGEPAHTLFITDTFEKYDISKDEFPIIHARPISVMKAISEILWIWQDQSNSLDVLEEKHYVHWWNQWDIGNRTIGARYGEVVKRYNFVGELISKLTYCPNDRRMIYDLNQRIDLMEDAKLDACAFMTSWSVRKGHYLDMCLTIRSNDYLVAGSINRMQYVALMMMIAQATGYVPGVFSVHTVNLHIYENQMEQLETILARKDAVSEIGTKLWITEEYPKLVLDPEVKNFYDFKVSDFKLVNYNPITPQVDAFELAV